MPAFLIVLVDITGRGATEKRLPIECGNYDDMQTAEAPATSYANSEKKAAFIHKYKEPMFHSMPDSILVPSILPALFEALKVKYGKIVRQLPPV